MNQAATPSDTDLWGILSCVTTEGQARLAALKSVRDDQFTPASKVDFRSGGELLIIGPEPSALSVLGEIDQQISCAILAVIDWHQESSQPLEPLVQIHTAEGGRRVPIVKSPLSDLSGHFGQFVVQVSQQDKTESLARLLKKERPYFDLVLDLGREPVLKQERLPEGYFAPRGSATELQRALDQLPGLIGEFEKPKYVEYFEDRCAHGERGVTGCTRCIDVCSSSAIRSVGERIEVDPYLCQGAGCCASACPTNALIYTYPRVEDIAERVRKLIQTYYKNTEIAPILILHNADEGARQLHRIAHQLPENVVPLSVEEVGSIGWDLWLSALSYGAGGVVQLVNATTRMTETEELNAQLGYANDLLNGMGFSLPAAHLFEGEDDELLGFLTSLSPMAFPVKATFTPQADKRTQFRLVFDHLFNQAPNQVDSVALPSGAPFGEVLVDREACTLCMACASVCPMSALMAGDDRPQLQFNEWNCVQCGMCQTACPESAISYQPRVLCNPEERRKVRVLYEEEPFHCVECGKPFATQGVIAKMQDQLKDHRMFQGDGLRRLQMCDECRVKDMFSAGDEDLVN